MSSRRPQSIYNQVDGNVIKETKEVADSKAIDLLFEMSNLLNTGLDRKQLICAINLLEGGTNPTALAGVIRELRITATEKRR